MSGKLFDFNGLKLLSAENCELSNVGSNVVNFLSAELSSRVRRNVELHKMFNSNINIADSKWIRILVRLKHSEFRGIRGADFVRTNLLSIDDVSNHLILAPNAEVIDAINNFRATNQKQSIPSYILPENFKNQTHLESLVSFLRRTEPNEIWLGISSPLQNLVANSLMAEYPAIYYCVGAGLGFSVGQVREAPDVWQALGLEWLFRLIQEPKRLWKRYLMGNLQFTIDAIRYLVPRFKK